MYCVLHGLLLINILISFYANCESMRAAGYIVMVRSHYIRHTRHIQNRTGLRTFVWESQTSQDRPGVSLQHYSYLHPVRCILIKIYCL